MTKVKVLQELHRWKKYGPWKAGQVVELPEEDAEQAAELGLVALVETEEGRQEKQEGGRAPVLSLPVKTGGQSWLEISLWEPDPEAEEGWKKHARISVRRRALKENKVETRETLYLSPSEAVLLGGLLISIGVKGKELDKEAEKEEEGGERGSG